jgi:hypothetical protein
MYPVPMIVQSRQRRRIGEIAEVRAEDRPDSQVCMARILREATKAEFNAQAMEVLGISELEFSIRYSDSWPFHYEVAED